MNLNEKFWVVWNPEHGLPHMRHHSYALAETEAKRLAGLHPGQKFYVMEGAALVVREEPISVFRLDDPLPF